MTEHLLPGPGRQRPVLYDRAATSATPAASASWPTSHGRPSRAILDAALGGLERLRHRGAVAADARTGDGAGVLVPLPAGFFAGPEARRPAGRLGVAMAFLPAPPRTPRRPAGWSSRRWSPRGWSCSAGAWSRSTTPPSARWPGRTRPPSSRPCSGRSDADPRRAERRCFRAGRRAALAARAAEVAAVPRLLLDPDGHLQGAVRGRPARRLLPRPGRPRLRGRLRRVPPALLDQHHALLGARPAVPLPLPQRRDQHPRRQRGLDAGPRGAPGGRRAGRGPAAAGARPRRLRLRQARQRGGAAGQGRPRPPPRPGHAGPGGRAPSPGRRPPGPARLLPLPRLPDRAVGRPGRPGLHRRPPGRGGPGPQRAAADALGGDRGRPGRVRVGGRRGRHRRPRPGAAGPARARADALRRPRARAAHRRPDQGRAGRQPALERLGGRAPARRAGPAGRSTRPPTTAAWSPPRPPSASPGSWSRPCCGRWRPPARSRRPPWATTRPRPCSGPPPGRSATSCASASPRSPTRPSTTCASATCCRAGPCSAAATRCSARSRRRPGWSSWTASSSPPTGWRPSATRPSGCARGCWTPPGRRPRARAGCAPPACASARRRSRPCATAPACWSSPTPPPNDGDARAGAVAAGRRGGAAAAAPRGPGHQDQRGRRHRGAGRLPPGGHPARLRGRRHLPPAHPGHRGHARTRTRRPPRTATGDALEEGVFKIMTKMGISVLDAYRGAQIFEAVGLDEEVVDLCFAGTPSPLGGIGLDELACDALDRHQAGQAEVARLENPGWFKHRPGGEYHATNPEVMQALHFTVREGAEMKGSKRGAHLLQQAVKGAGSSATGTSPAWSTSARRPPCATCSSPPGRPRRCPLEEVEPAANILARFSTAAMSLGSLSPGGPRDPGHRPQPGRRPLQLRRGRRGPGPLRHRAQLGHQAGRLRPLRGHPGVPGQRRRAADQDRPGLQAGRGRPAPRPQGQRRDRPPAPHPARGWP